MRSSWVSLKKVVFKITCTCQSAVVLILIFIHNLSHKAYGWKFNSSIEASCQVSAKRYEDTV